MADYQGTNDYVFGSLAANNLDTPFVWKTDGFPANFDLKEWEDYVENQLAVSDCVSNAATSQVEIFEAYANGWKTADMRNYSRLFGYYNAIAEMAKVLGQPVSDNGTTGLLVLGKMTELGVCEEATWPYSHKFDEKPSDEAYTEALLHKVGRFERCGKDTYNILTGESVHRGLEADLKVALLHGMPVIFGIALHESFPNITGPVETHPAQYRGVAMYAPGWIGNHEMVIIGWRTLPDNRTLWIVENSWGPEWGDGGFLGITTADLKAGWEFLAVRSFNGIDADIPLSLYHWTADAELRNGLKVSVDIAGIPGQVSRLYKASFKRMPDYSGLGYWINTGKTVGLAAIADSFVTSKEFQDMYGSLGDVQFVDLLYRNVMEREADADGLAYWTGRLAAGATRGAVMIGFSESDEFKIKTKQCFESGIYYN